MANDNTKLQYIVELLTQGDTKRATEELTKLGAAGKSAGTGMNTATAGAKQLFAFLGGSALIMESVGKFLEAERGINALNYALEQTKNNAPGVRDAILQMAEALGDDFKVQADDVIKVMTQLLSFGANPKDLKRLTEFVYDLSEVMGRDVPRAARQMSQALRGNFEVFNALGIEVDKTKLASEGLNEAMGKGEKIVSGRWRASVKGVAGDIQALGVTLENAKQQLGKWESAVLTAVAAGAENLADLMTRPDLEQSINQQKDAYNSLADSIARAILQAEKLGKITKAEAGQMFGKLGGAREILRGGLTDFGQTTSDEDLRAIKETRLPMARGLMSGLQTRLKLSQNSPSAGQGSPPPSAGQGPIEAPGLSEKDLDQIIDHWNELAEVEQKLAADQLESRRLIANEVDLEMKETFERFENGERIKQDLVDQTVLVMLEGEARIQAEMEITHDNRIQAINEEKFETQEQYDAAVRAEALLYAEERKRFEQARNGTAQLNQSLQDIGERAQELAASGLVDAMWSIADGSKSAGAAFREFAASFSEDVSKMILKAYALYAIQQLLGMFSGGGGGAKGVGGGVSGSGAQFANYAAEGGQWTAMADGGMVSVSSPTLLPKFNVLAGEAGREMLTVLARPSFERINGVPAQIGYAGGNRLAITSADALAGAGGGGMGGQATVRIELAPGLVATLKQDSIQGARIAIVQDMSTDSQLSRVTRQKLA